MLNRLLVVMSLALLGCGDGGGGAATGGGSAAGGGSGTGGGDAAGGGSGACAVAPFGLFAMAQCDGGTLSSSLTFFSDGGATFTSSDTGACGVDRVSCELLLTCSDAYVSQFSLDWAPADEHLVGTWLRNGVSSSCVQFNKL